jgi:copper chaperone
VNLCALKRYLKFIEGLVGRSALMAEITLRIDGMHCGSCIRRVTQAINTAGAFEVEEVRLGAARFRAPDPSETNAAIAALAKAGYPARIDEV